MLGKFQLTFSIELSNLSRTFCGEGKKQGKKFYFLPYSFQEHGLLKYNFIPQGKFYGHLEEGL